MTSSSSIFWWNSEDLLGTVGQLSLEVKAVVELI